jgi:hypothetical protein
MNVAFTCYNEAYLTPPPPIPMSSFFLVYPLIPFLKSSINSSARMLTARRAG